MSDKNIPVPLELEKPIDVGAVLRAESLLDVVALDLVFSEARRMAHAIRYMKSHVKNFNDHKITEQALLINLLSVLGTVEDTP